jgi:hypothetical protein
MSKLFTLSEIPCWYWALALAITAYQGYRGFRLQWLLGLGSPHQVAAQPAAQQAEVNLSVPDRVMLLSLADCLTYALCALSGFYALVVAYRAAHLTSATDAPIAHPAVLIFLLLYGVLGATGKLPDTLNRLKAPGFQ